MKSRIIATIAALSAAIVGFGAAAMAQPAVYTIPNTVATPGATGTITVTAQLTPTFTPAPKITATSIVTGTAGTAPTPIPTIPLPTSIYEPGGQGDFEYADPAFERVWKRTDKLVAENKVARTWFWGPGPNTPGLLEEYRDAPPQLQGRRTVQYFDKSRMEINNPTLDSRQPFYVTNGLLTVELISGYIQVGNQDFIKFHPACIPMTGDFGDTLAPTYYAFQSVSNTQAGDHDAPERIGEKAADTINRDGKVGSDPTKASVKGVTFVRYENKHNIPAIFWDFLNSSGPIYDESAKVASEPLIKPWFYASGLPISEPYWAKARIRGAVTDVLIQAYERRTLTYVPSNEKGFQVEMGNIGQHYFDWRYRNYGVCPGAVPTTPTPPVPALTATPVAGTPQPIPATPVVTPTATRAVEPVGTPIP